MVVSDTWENMGLADPKRETSRQAKPPVPPEGLRSSTKLETVRVNPPLPGFGQELADELRDFLWVSFALDQTRNESKFPMLHAKLVREPREPFMIHAETWTMATSSKKCLL